MCFRGYMLLIVEASLDPHVCNNLWVETEVIGGRKFRSRRGVRNCNVEISYRTKVAERRQFIKGRRYLCAIRKKMVLQDWHLQRIRDRAMATRKS